MSQETPVRAAGGYRDGFGGDGNGVGVGGRYGGGGSVGGGSVGGGSRPQTDLFCQTGGVLLFADLLMNCGFGPSCRLVTMELKHSEKKQINVSGFLCVS